MIFINFELRTGEVRTVNPDSIDSIGEVDGYGAIYTRGGEVLVTKIQAYKNPDGKTIPARVRLTQAVHSSVDRLAVRKELRGGLSIPIGVPQ